MVFIYDLDMNLSGEQVALKPMTKEDKTLFFEMATKSAATPFLYGEMCGNEIPTWDEIFHDYKDYYFDGSEPENGRCFSILLNNEVIGQVNYNDIDRSNDSVELDIWIADDNNTGKGFGSDALQVLMQYLSSELNVETFIICPSIENPRAIKAYENVGFGIVKEFGF